MRTSKPSEADRDGILDAPIRRSTLLTVAAFACLAAPGSLLLLDACVGETPTDCVSRLNCGASSEAGADVNQHADAGVHVPDVASQDADATTKDAEAAAQDVDSAVEAGDAGQVQDAPIDTWDGFDGFYCDPKKSPRDEQCVVDEAFGIFVAPAPNGGSDGTGDGSRAKPYSTIAHALGNLGDKTRVYVCDGSYMEHVTLSAAVSLYGGLACPIDDAGSAWSYVGGQAQITGPENQIALLVSGVTSAISIEDMSFSAPNASGQDSNGNGLSSIAALVNASTATLRRCALSAGNGERGNDGMQGANYSGATAPQGGVNDGGISGAGGAIICKDGTNSTGGNGGNATLTTATDGGNGDASPVPQTYPSLRLDGLGGSGGFACTPGDKGAYGAAGTAGTAATTYGTLTPNGWTPSGGDPGHAGYPGQGGGGGGGLAGSLPLGGAGGGAGGCGGAGGGGGKGGGASIALGCIASSVTLEACTLVTANGGNGGKGGDGQQGQGGALAGAADVLGNCAGGIGGNGAGGSAGAGGTGGSSLCIVYAGTGPTGTPSCTSGDAGRPGMGGAGGDGGSNALGYGPSGADAGVGLTGLATGSWQVQ